MLFTATGSHVPLLCVERVTIVLPDVFEWASNGRIDND